MLPCRGVCSFLLLLTLSACSDDPTSPAPSRAQDDIIASIANELGITGAVGVAEMPDGRLLLGSKLGTSAFTVDGFQIDSRTTNAGSIDRTANVQLQGNDAPLGSLFILVEPGGGGTPYMGDADNTSGINWTFGCVVSGQFFPMDHARIDSTVVTAIDQTGGHNNVLHDLAAKPKGVWDPSATPTTNGMISQSYTADVAAGDERVDFYWVITDPAAPPGCRDEPQSLWFLTGIRLLGLVELVAGTEHIYFQGISSDHFSVFYVTPEVKTATETVAQRYFAATNGTDSLRVNAASLIYGGLNDAPIPDWTPPHDSHRIGTDLDLDGKNDSQGTHDLVLKATARIGFHRCFAELNETTGIRDHIHCYYQAY